ncbi:hypothetical protein D3C80_1835470 [compost metagenome]
MDHLRTLGLQLLDHRLAGQQSILLLVKAVDFLVLLLDLVDLGLQVGVAIVLPADLHVVVEPDQQRQQQATQGGHTQHDAELALALLAPFGAPGQ